MGRFFEHRDTNIPSMFIPYPLDFIQQKVGDAENLYNTTKTVARVESETPAYIDAINWAGMDTGYRESLNNTIKEEASKAVDLLSIDNLDRNNPLGSIEEAAKIINRVKRLKEEINTPGTHAYFVAENKKKETQFEKDINQDANRNPQERTGYKNRVRYEYASDGSGGYYDPKTKTFKEFPTYEKAVDYNIEKELFSFIKSSETKKTGSSGEGFNDDQSLIVGSGWTSEKRTPTEISNMFKSFMTSGDAFSKMTERIKDLAWYYYGGNSEEDIKSRESFINEQLVSLVNGGVTEGKIDNTMAGNMLNAAIEAYEKDDYSSFNRIETSPFYDYEGRRVKGTTDFYTGTIGVKEFGKINWETISEQVSGYNARIDNYNRLLKDKPDPYTWTAEDKEVARQGKESMLFKRRSESIINNGLFETMNNVTSDSSFDNLPVELKGKIQKLKEEGNFVEMQKLLQQQKEYMIQGKDYNGKPIDKNVTEDQKKTNKSIWDFATFVDKQYNQGKKTINYSINYNIKPLIADKDKANKVYTNLQGIKGIASIAGVTDLITGKRYFATDKDEISLDIFGENPSGNYILTKEDGTQIIFENSGGFTGTSEKLAATLIEQGNLQAGTEIGANYIKAGRTLQILTLYKDEVNQLTPFFNGTPINKNFKYPIIGKDGEYELIKGEGNTFKLKNSTGYESKNIKSVEDFTDVLYKINTGK